MADQPIKLRVDVDLSSGSDQSTKTVIENPHIDRIEEFDLVRNIDGTPKDASPLPVVFPIVPADASPALRARVSLDFEEAIKYINKHKIVPGEMIWLCDLEQTARVKAIVRKDENKKYICHTIASTWQEIAV